MLRIDFGWAYDGSYWFVLVDAFSKCMEINRVSIPSPIVEISLLRQHFSWFGVLHSLFSDNGPCFISEKMKDISAEYQIKHIRTAPFHSRTCLRNTLHGKTGRPPVELIFGHKLRIGFDNMRPDIQSKNYESKFNQKKKNAQTPEKDFSETSSADNILSPDLVETKMEDIRPLLRRSLSLEGKDTLKYPS
ncbi:hypothetical protein RF11_14377 [Thelohanellus kitauei]|nr:hypothetical protein RF11_14377 [Thelohanellus kitauei]